MTTSERQLRRQGYPQADIDLAKRQQEAEKRTGAPLRSLAEVIGGKPARLRPDAAPADLTARQLRGRGRYGQAALLSDQGALLEKDAERAMKAREASNILNGLAAKPAQMEFGFFMGNVSTGEQYYDAILARLKASGASGSKQRDALATLGTIIRWLGWQTYACQKNAEEIADILVMDAAQMSRTLKLLENVGAISRLKRGQMKIIVVTPEGAYRGDITRHAEAVDRYRSDVVTLRQPS